MCLTEFLEQAYKLLLLVLAKDGKNFLDTLDVSGQGFLDKLSAFICQTDGIGTPITGALLPPNPAVLFHVVEDKGHIARGG